MKNNVELMSLYWTICGDFGNLDSISRFDFKDRVESAARAGFKGIGIWHSDLEHITRQRSLKEMKMILDDNDMKYVELEFLTDWFLEDGDERKAASDRLKLKLLEASEVLQAKHVKIGDFYNRPVSLPRVIEAFAGLCHEAENYGATIGFEVMSCSMIDNLKDAITLVESAGAKNGGLILDILQVVNLKMSHAEISRIPPQYLVNIELDDGTLPGSPNEDLSRTRRFCGDGEYDIRGLIQCAQKMGYPGPWAVEVMSQELSILPLDELTTRAYQTTLAEFAGL